MTVAERLITMTNDEKRTLSFIHDYMESRLTLLKNIEVRVIL
jgi:neurofibromin 1